MQRIRYVRSKTSPGLLESARYVIVDGKSYRVLLDESALTFVIALNGEHVVVTGSGSSKHDIRIRAKEFLENLGASFESEERER
jgi:hypothetical protein